MADALQYFKFATCLAHPAGAQLGAGSIGHGVDAHAALNTLDADVLALPVLKALAFSDEFDEPVVANLTVLVGGANACLGQSARNGAGLLAIDGVGRVGVDAVGKGSDDAVVAEGARLTTKKRRCFGDALQTIFERCGRQKNGWFNKRQANLGFGDGGLAL